MSDAPLSFAVQGRPLSRAEQLAETIRDTIAREAIEAGGFVGTLESIRETSGFARTTVSEAVKLLRDRGVLIVKPGRRGGLFVAQDTPTVRLRHTLMDTDADPATVADAIELRDELEELIAVRAAAHRTQVDIAELRILMGAMESAASWDEFMHANWALHERIARICPNSMARAVYLGTLGHLSGGRAHGDESVDESYWSQRLRIHQDLVEGIALGDEDSVRAAIAAHSAK